jgi:hypothetical protein
MKVVVGEAIHARESSSVSCLAQVARAKVRAYAEAGLIFKMPRSSK